MDEQIFESEELSSKNSNKKEKKDRKFKTYQNLLMYLKRKKIENSGKVATFLLDTYVNSPLEKRDGEFVLIFKHDLELAGILDKKEKFEDWRDLMIKRGILNWRVRPNDYQFINNKNYFAPSESLTTYINKEKISSSTVATMDDVGKLKSEVDELKIALKETNRKIEKVAEFVLHQNPPDTPERKQIVVDNIDDLPKALELLAQQRKQIDKNIQETGKMFN
ncbi:hypothetical protein GCL60_16440 [Silvanigrella paludirubra]|uniref:Uncharacterized protein n=1 Tax=Silvanigrella paludirubra TaxID=2499159 RepID=A0A6N6VP69_9BACT|nr:hypothetical protein [Silvanigrella paludirubra]KAB8035817.1 hypothetical protein GCL60_16440 [Silvanigrella paludirubra]